MCCNRTQRQLGSQAKRLHHHKPKYRRWSTGKSDRHSSTAYPIHATCVHVERCYKSILSQMCLQMQHLLVHRFSLAGATSCTLMLVLVTPCPSHLCSHCNEQPASAAKSDSSADGALCSTSVLHVSVWRLGPNINRRVCVRGVCGNAHCSTNVCVNCNTT